MSKKNSKSKEENPPLKKFREKRKWQIALRRYVLEKSLSVSYAPYFGLDIENIRKWFEMQFEEGSNWENFGKTWQFDHIIPVTYFDFEIEGELKLCWNFTNIRVEHFQKTKKRGNRLDVLAAKSYFKELYDTTSYDICRKLLLKIDQIELSEIISTNVQQNFIKANWEYLTHIQNYSSYEFELLNHGRTVEAVNKEIAFLKKMKGGQNTN